MKTRPLGPSGIEASVVALGTWQFGGWMWGGGDEDAAQRAVDAALDHGVNFIDTAPIYSLGHSEQLVGRALKGKRDRAVISTKCGMVANPEKGEEKFRVSALNADPLGLVDIHIYLGPESIREELELSLKRLGTDYIDLYFTHWQESTTAIADTMAELEKARDAGKIRAIGASNATPAHLAEYDAAGTLDADQEPFSMVKREKEADNLPYVREHGKAFLAYSPMQRGLLTGKLTRDRELAEGDHRKGDPLYGKASREKVQQMLAQFQPIADKHGVSMPALVIAWTVAQPGVSHALCGSRKPEHIIDTAKAGEIELGDDDLAAMNEAIDQYAGERV